MKMLSIAILFWVAASAFAHPGGRTADGCHVCRTNCDKHGLQTGERHCHTDLVKDFSTNQLSGLLSC